MGYFSRFFREQGFAAGEESFYCLHSPGNLAHGTVGITVRRTFAKSLRHHIEQGLKAPVFRIYNKALFVDTGMQEPYGRFGYIFYANEAIYSFGVPGKAFISIFEDGT